ncbi:SDR family NAD(P)-dependent oxidoreductase [Gemmatimonas groenlandica]|uniref:SDR family NAD(P)-dependent oxidoreductase n=1 Tax=Gemmatimonas groenlandica TaxID=2732249 RepID=A0A6M4IJM9_9BACT|nr:SDR family NAD(P)-dependent oxidoreductase [Gemmatimonas groenlandica]QJR34048.1 SDR family NAD(P)-dependent oxidoreductase [Gemmatimonas groenlandica]
MDLTLAGKRALVTGSSSGIGAEIARMLAYEGVKVVIHGRDVGRAGRLLEEIRATDGDAELALGDLTTDDGTLSVIACVDLGGGRERSRELFTGATGSPV